MANKMKVCPACGREWAENVIFCMACGERTVENTGEIISVPVEPKVDVVPVKEVPVKEVPVEKVPDIEDLIMAYVRKVMNEGDKNSAFIQELRTLIK